MAPVKWRSGTYGSLDFCYCQNLLTSDGTRNLRSSSVNPCSSYGHLVFFKVSKLVALRPSSYFTLRRRKLRTLRLANNPLLNDKAFPSPLTKDVAAPEPLDEKPLPHRPTTWLEKLPPLILRHSADNLRVLDLTNCRITDEAVEGIVAHAPKIQTFILSGCSLLTDGALESVSKLGDNLDVLMLAHVSNITDRAVIKLTRACTNLRCVDVACKLVHSVVHSSSLC